MRLRLDTLDELKALLDVMRHRDERSEQRLVHIAETLTLLATQLDALVTRLNQVTP